MSFWEELYANLRPVAQQDAQNDFALQKFCQAVGLPFESVYELVRDDQTGGQVGWSILLDPNRVPDDYLPWLLQMVGTRPLASETADSMRGRIYDGETYKRGTPQSLEDAAARAGATRFIIQERYTGSAWQVRFLFDSGEFTDEMLARVVAKLPAGIVWSYGFWGGMTYDTMKTTFTNYANVLASTASYTDLSG